MNGVLIETPALGVFEQMAVDEALARSHPEAFCLRFFRWKGVGLTFGYAQRFRAVEKLLPPEVGENWTRRPTGGGVVPHLNDLTFSCVFPDAGGVDSTRIYRRLHSAIQQALDAGGLEVRLSASNAEGNPHGSPSASQCFQEPVAMDILSGEDKILGGAIRRLGTTVLYQGSLQLPDARQKASELEPLLQVHIGEEWGVRWTTGGLDKAVQAQASALTPKYRSLEWIQKR
jgi:lipoate-protein ligase A